MHKKWLGPIIWLCFFLTILGCAATPEPQPTSSPSLFNLAHLDYLGETVMHEGDTLRIIHIYANAPEYAWTHDDDEGAACVDDAARAAVVYLRHFELTGDADSRSKAEALLRFVLYMQRENGLFYNFVWNSQLDINTEHDNSRADTFGWWAARGVWALGMGARVLKTANPSLAAAAAEGVQRTLPHLRQIQERYGETIQHQGRTVPQWLLYETAADATSELLLGLVAYQQTYLNPEVSTLIDRFAEGIAMMQYGSMQTFPYGGHASWIDAWHGWGNSQTMALAEAGHLASAKREAEQFYPRLLVDGWLHSIPFDTTEAEIRKFEQIAYAVRAMSVGLIRLAEATDDDRYARMAGLAASWLTGNNVADTPMYDPQTGRGFDGINSPTVINHNAGAESTIEALFTILEMEQHPEARRWLSAQGEPIVHLERDGKQMAYRVFTAGSGEDAPYIAIVMNHTDETTEVLEGEALDLFLHP
ncbi:MAG TPA: hypothetical protein VKP65_01110 [Rhodothermales bacterium]|nr:hypothetical protein [Rhodothermales bacterium]